MYNKKKNLIFTIILVMLVCVMIVAMVIIKNDSEESSTLSSEDLAKLNEAEQAEMQELQSEWNEMSETIREAEANAEYHKGEYKDRYDSREINKEFITDKYKFRHIMSYAEMEFLGYEEIDDLTEYFSGLNVTMDGISGAFEYGFTNDLCKELQKGLINTDGTFNTFTQKKKVRYGDLDYGEETIIENQKLKAVKLTVKYTNLLPTENEIWLYNMHYMEDFTYLDDGKLYRKTMVYKSDYTTGGEPIYTNMADKFLRDSGGVNPSCIVLEPKEEYIGEIIYIFVEDEMEDMYLVMDEGYNTNIENFNATEVYLLPFTELEKLGEK